MFTLKVDRAALEAEVVNSARTCLRRSASKTEFQQALFRTHQINQSKREQITILAFNVPVCCVEKYRDVVKEI